MKLLNGDCLELLKSIPDNSVDAVVSDPPYELGFVGMLNIQVITLMD